MDIGAFDELLNILYIPTYEYIHITLLCTINICMHIYILIIIINITIIINNNNP